MRRLKVPDRGKVYSKDPKEAMAEYLTTLNDDVKKTILSHHLTALCSYLRTALVHGHDLTRDEDRDRQVRMREFLAIGKSFGLTNKQLVENLFKGLFENPQACNCVECLNS